MLIRSCLFSVACAGLAMSAPLLTFMQGGQADMILVAAPAVARAQTPPAALAAEPRPDTCGDYEFNSVQVNLQPSFDAAVAGTPLKFSGTIENSTDFPIADGAVYVKIFAAGEVVDAFWVARDIEVPAAGAQTIDMTWQVPGYSRAGDYMLATYFIVADQYTLLGEPAGDTVMGNRAYFSVTSEQTGGVSFKLQSVAVAADGIVSAELTNATKTAQTVPVTWTLYRGVAGPIEEQQVQEVADLFTVQPGQTQTLTFKPTREDESPHSIVGTAHYQDTKSMVSLPLGPARHLVRTCPSDTVSQSDFTPPSQRLILIASGLGLLVLIGIFMAMKRRRQRWITEPLLIIAALAGISLASFGDGTRPSVYAQGRGGTVPECHDGVDNNRNGPIDMADSDCTAPDDDEGAQLSVILTGPSQIYAGDTVQFVIAVRNLSMNATARNVEILDLFSGQAGSFYQFMSATSNLPCTQAAHLGCYAQELAPGATQRITLTFRIHSWYGQGSSGTCTGGTLSALAWGAANWVDFVYSEPLTTTYSCTRPEPPHPPVISGPRAGLTNVLHQFTVKADDPAQQNVRYGIDWDGNNTVDLWLPSAVAFVPAGTSEPFSRLWTLVGPKTFRAKAHNVHGLESGWATHTITLQDPPPPLPSLASCAPAHQNYTVGQAAPATFTTAVHHTTASWNASAGTPTSGTGTTFSAHFFTPGLQTVSVSASAPPFYDVTGDGAVGQDDVLAVVANVGRPGEPGAGAPWQNQVNRFDVGGDGSVSIPLDALVIINYLSASGPGPLPSLSCQVTVTQNPPPPTGLPPRAAFDVPAKVNLNDTIPAVSTSVPGTCPGQVCSNLTYLWRVVRLVDGADVTPAVNTTPNITVLGDQVGDYKFTLTATDNLGRTSSAMKTTTVVGGGPFNPGPIRETE